MSSAPEDAVVVRSDDANGSELTREELIERLEAMRPEFAKLMRQFGAHEPDWKPLEKALPPEKCEDFMFMGYCDGKRMYKHYITRKYLHLDEEGNAYRWDGYSRYFPQHLEEAVKHALEDLEWMLPSEERPGDY